MMQGIRVEGTPATTKQSCELGAGVDAHKLDARVRALIDTYFERVALPENGLEFKNRAVEGKTVENLITELAALVLTVRAINLTPKRCLTDTISRYSQALTSIEDRQVFGVEGSQGKNREDMEARLYEQRPIMMSFAKRETGASVVGVLLRALLTGKNPLDDRDLRDSVGVLFSDSNWLNDDGWNDGSAHPRIRAFGSLGK